jgi:predicted SAM-dependent methyltransferase
MTIKQHIGRLVIGHLPVGRRSFDILRFEFRIMRERWSNRLPWRSAHIRQLRKMRDISLNVGSGGRGLRDWVNMDATSNHSDIYCTHDLRQPLPLEDASVLRIFAEHVVEHIDFQSDVPRVFREFHRVLKPGGVVRIVVPDTARFMQAYLDNDPAQWASLGFANLPEDMNSWMELVNHVFHQGGEHCFGWDFTSMSGALWRAGFSRIVRQSYGNSSDPELAIDQPNHESYSLYVEAIK